MGNEEVDLITVAKPQEKQTLLRKWDIPVENLSYEYIAKCTNVKEIERIVLILRSGEEGIFPDLIKHAEKCLAKLKPNSKVLRVEEPVLTRAMLDPEDRKSIDEDIANWMNEMHTREKDLEEGKALSSTAAIPQPEIREPRAAARKKILESTKNRVKSQKAIASCDYAGWDKFDADAELDRIDLQDEKKQADAKNAQLIRKEKYEEAKKLSKESIIDKLSLTATELSVLAEQERNIGNEAFRAGDYEEALIRYNSSITISSTINAYNNRAITYIKLERYQDAVNDCNLVLTMEYNNVTALMRRALASEHLEKYSQALVDYQSILRLEPNNKLAIAGVNRLRKPSDSKKVRMKIEEESENGTEKNTVDVVEKKVESEKNSDKCQKIELSETRFNSVPEICFCDRAPSFSRSPKPPPHYKSSYCLTQSNYCVPKKSKSQQSFLSDVKISSRQTERDRPCKLTIEELPNDDEIRGTKNSKVDAKVKRESKLKNKDEKIATFKTTKGTEKNKSVERMTNKNSNGMKKKPAEPVTKPEQKARGTPEKKINAQKSKCEKSSADRAKIKEVANEVNLSDGPGKTDPLESIGSPYEFLRNWQSLKNDKDFSQRARLLRSLAPEDLCNVIGNKLDGDMFAVIMRCLDRHFSNNEENLNLAERFLTALTKLSRFSIVRLFTNAEDKTVLRRIFEAVDKKISSTAADSLRNMYDL
ncbi:sperm-associated antigen 1 [Athalia rosae]|uniref:sperm-associated antigen 1 n=1 Tax=Athalia rosae TaxID=37344 RepID=UPI00203423B0|nr:sperm-associated antigen 1 [Athalia rosae]